MTDFFAHLLLWLACACCVFAVKFVITAACLAVARAGDGNLFLAAVTWLSSIVFSDPRQLARVRAKAARSLGLADEGPDNFGTPCWTECREAPVVCSGRGECAVPTARAPPVPMARAPPVPTDPPPSDFFAAARRLPRSNFTAPRRDRHIGILNEVDLHFEATRGGMPFNSRTVLGRDFSQVRELAQTFRVQLDVEWVYMNDKFFVHTGSPHPGTDSPQPFVDALQVLPAKPKLVVQLGLLHEADIGNPSGKLLVCSVANVARPVRKKWVPAAAEEPLNPQGPAPKEPLRKPEAYKNPVADHREARFKAEQDEIDGLIASEVAAAQGRASDAESESDDDDQPEKPEASDPRMSGKRPRACPIRGDVLVGAESEADQQSAAADASDSDEDNEPEKETEGSDAGTGLGFPAGKKMPGACPFRGDIRIRASRTASG